MQVISEDQYLRSSYFGEDALTVGMARPSARPARRAELEEIKVLLREESQTTKSQTKRRSSPSASSRGSVPRIGNRPEWMILEVIPVIPPELRLSFARRRPFRHLRLNDLYRRDQP